MSRYGYDYGFQNDRQRAAMRGYDGDQRFVANDMGTWSSRPFSHPQQGGFQGRQPEQFGRGYDRGMSFHQSDAIPRRMGQSYGGGYDRQHGFFGGNQQPRQGYFNRGYDRSGGYDFQGGYSGQNQQGGWQDIYRQVDRPRAGGMASPWESNIPGMGMRRSFPFGMTGGGSWF